VFLHAFVLQRAESTGEFSQQYEPLGREEGKMFRRASYLQFHLSRLCGVQGQWREVLSAGKQ